MSHQQWQGLVHNNSIEKTVSIEQYCKNGKGGCWLWRRQWGVAYRSRCVYRRNLQWCRCRLLILNFLNENENQTVGEDVCSPSVRIFIEECTHAKNECKQRTLIISNSSGYSFDFFVTITTKYRISESDKILRSMELWFRQKWLYFLPES